MLSFWKVYFLKKKQKNKKSKAEDQHEQEHNDVYVYSLKKKQEKQKQQTIFTLGVETSLSNLQARKDKEKTNKNDWLLFEKNATRNQPETKP